MNIHIFIDAENVPMANAITTCNVLAEGNDVTRCDVVGKEDTLSPAYVKRQSKTFRIHNCDYGKNSADMYLTVLIAKAIYEERDTDIPAIVSNERDFAPVIAAIAELRHVLVIHGKGSGALRKGIHEFLRRNRSVASFQLADIDEGGSGATLVEIS